MSLLWFFARFLAATAPAPAAAAAVDFGMDDEDACSVRVRVKAARPPPPPPATALPLPLPAPTSSQLFRVAGTDFERLIAASGLAAGETGEKGCSFWPTAAGGTAAEERWPP